MAFPLILVRSQPVSDIDNKSGLLLIRTWSLVEDKGEREC
jgi:hypothetical protein